MNIFIDKKRVERDGNLTNESLDSTLNITEPYAYILERNGPDCIGGELKLRVPSGRYGAEWSNGSFGEVLNLYNNFVAKERAILIHGGNSPKRSDGCLLIKAKEVKYNNGNIIDNVLDKKAYKKLDFTKHIKDNFKSYVFGAKSNKGISDIMRQIEVRITQIPNKNCKINVEIARLKAFMYALRYGEGTLGARGYQIIVGGGVFEDFSKHPNIYIKKFNSTAAGAYQFLSTTWNGIVSQYGKKYKIDDFSPKNQDKACLVLLLHIRESINLIMDNKIDEAIRSRIDKPKKRLYYEWASLPDSPYGQRAEKMEDFMRYYNKHLQEELRGISNLAMSNEDFIKFLQLARNIK